MKKKTKNLCLCALFCAVIVCSAQISVPMPSGVCFTLQSFAAALIGFSLKTRRAIVCGITYLALGAVGLPVFSAFTGGMGVLLGATGGFLWGLPVFSALCGISFYVNQKIYKAALLIFAVALLHLGGVLWFSHITGNALLPSFLLASLIYLPKDIISVFVAHLVAKRIEKFLN